MQLALFCSIDTLLASAGVGLLGCPGISRRRLVLAFIMSDSIASLAGASLNSGLGPLYRWVSVSLGAAVLLPLVAVAILACAQKFPRLVFSIPILLSVDNFIAGLLESSVHAAQFALLAGLASGTAAWMGVAIGQFAALALSRGRAFVAGVSLIALAFLLLN